MPKPCRHRTTSYTVETPITPTFSVPTDAGPIDALVEYICSRPPEMDEVLVNVMALMFTSPKTRMVIETTADVVKQCKNEPVGDPELRAMEFLLAVGFLTGTAIGFAAGLEFESDDNGDEFDGMDFVSI